MKKFLVGIFLMYVGADGVCIPFEQIRIVEAIGAIAFAVGFFLFGLALVEVAARGVLGRGCAKEDEIIKR